MNFSSIDEIVQELLLGNFIILMDNEKRENEGDLVVLSNFISNDKLRFIINKTKNGMMCVAVDEVMALRMGLKPQYRHNTTDNDTSIAVSVDAKNGIKSGISVSDRVQTIKTLISAYSTYDDIVMPGHVIPLIAKPRGVLERQGHTEAVVDLARIANSMSNIDIPASGVLCEILNDEGNPMNREEISVFAYKHKIKVSSIDNLVLYLNDRK